MKCKHKDILVTSENTGSCIQCNKVVEVKY